MKNTIVNKVVVERKLRTAWNKGKKKPYADDMGNLWCDCESPKLTSNAGGRGLALCLLCSTPWYH